MGIFKALLAGQLTGWDFLVAGIIVLFVEYVVKFIIKDAQDKTKKVIFKLSPIVIGGISYTALALIGGGEWDTGLVHGLAVGLTAMGSYDLILDTVKKAGKKSIEDINEAVKKVVEGNK